MILSSFHFAARKLPQLSVALVSWPLADEVITVLLYDGCKHVGYSHSRGMRLLELATANVLAFSCERI